MTSAGIPTGPSVPDWDPPASYLERLEALESRRFQVTYDMLGPEPRQSDAIEGDPAVTSYDFQTGARSGSTVLFIAGLNAYVAAAYWQVVWVPQAVGCGVEIVSFDDSSVFTQMAAWTGLATVTPRNDFVDITTAFRALLVPTAAAVPTTSSANRTVGTRLKGDGTVGPRIHASRLIVLWETV